MVMAAIARGRWCAMACAPVGVPLAGAVMGLDMGVSCRKCGSDSNCAARLVSLNSAYVPRASLARVPFAVGLTRRCHAADTSATQPAPTYSATRVSSM